MSVDLKLKAPLPDIETDRLRLRRFRASDVDGLAKVFAKPEVWQFPYGRAFTRAETEGFINIQIAEWDRYGVGVWIAEEKSLGAIIGYVGLSVPHFLPDILPALEVGWRFDPDVWSNGYATEGAAAALDQAFTTLGLARVCSAPQSINPPSVRVCERLGMTFERKVIAAGNKMRGPVDVDLYWIGKEDWRVQSSSG